MSAGDGYPHPPLSSRPVRPPQCFRCLNLIFSSRSVASSLCLNMSVRGAAGRGIRCHARGRRDPALCARGCRSQCQGVGAVHQWSSGNDSAQERGINHEQNETWYFFSV
ncbi:hypothetical protein ABZP36_009087 [Zizania latifolia]